jgi:hypothetical protein
MGPLLLPRLPRCSAVLALQDLSCARDDGARNEDCGLIHAGTMLLAA